MTNLQRSQKSMLQLVATNSALDRFSLRPMRNNDCTSTATFGRTFAKNKPANLSPVNFFCGIWFYSRR